MVHAKLIAREVVYIDNLTCQPAVPQPEFLERMLDSELPEGKQRYSFVELHRVACELKTRTLYDMQELMWSKDQELGLGGDISVHITKRR